MRRMYTDKLRTIVSALNEVSWLHSQSSTSIQSFDARTLRSISSLADRRNYSEIHVLMDLFYLCVPRMPAMPSFRIK